MWCDISVTWLANDTESVTVLTDEGTDDNIVVLDQFTKQIEDDN